jgi:hypothetical protein
VAFHWPDSEWGNRDTAVLTTYSGVLEGPGDSRSGKALMSSQFGPVFDRAILEGVPPFGDHFAGALLDAAICFTLAELNEAGEVAFEANSDGSVGDQCGEPLWWLKA